jgi:diguanylate cyclase (GGDEF)-like protein
MHLHFGRSARPDSETAPLPEPEPELERALALAPDAEPGDVVPDGAVPPIVEPNRASPEANEPGQATDAAPLINAGPVTDAAPAVEAGPPIEAVVPSGDPDPSDVAPADPDPLEAPTAEVWPEMDPVGVIAPAPARRDGRNGDPAPVGLTAPTLPSGWTDPMTSADGPHYWDRLISSERDRMRRYHRPATVVFIELANLDRLGALWGDDVAAQALIRVGRTLMRQIRSSDHAARIDLAKFAVFLPETNEIAAINFVERVRASIDTSLGFMDETLRVGIGWASPADGDIDLALATAQRRLDADLGRD